ncbi:MAG: hypothetical protein V4471_02625 [Pseudomonadota bacterium]
MFYTIQYNRQTQSLEFRHRETLGPSRLNSLFHNFGYSLANIVMGVRRTIQYSERLTNINFNAIQYYNDTQYNELITDIVFLHGIYREHDHHHPGFINEQRFVQWRDAIQNVNQTAILKLLYSDNKISRAYYFRYALNHPASLRNLVIYNLFINNTLGDTGQAQAEKIDKLPLPASIKADLKLGLILGM